MIYVYELFLHYSSGLEMRLLYIRIKFTIADNLGNRQKN
ncbi:hypothetical protein D1AOALGA4SA_5994 [Olavius algarvensis Delta 1 endosymbiont]|nr:hypothetical protein D1AOALGA4SA_5994 [Olavius algarvensis Delta 1 endosymbiont]